jgi:hypothetical protein
MTRVKQNARAILSRDQCDIAQAKKSAAKA